MKFLEESTLEFLNLKEKKTSKKSQKVRKTKKFEKTKKDGISLDENESSDIFSEKEDIEDYGDFMNVSEIFSHVEEQDSPSNLSPPPASPPLETQPSNIFLQKDKVEENQYLENIPERFPNIVEEQQSNQLLPQAMSSLVDPNNETDELVKIVRGFNYYKCLDKSKKLQFQCRLKKLIVSFEEDLLDSNLFNSRE